jgi:hypothetical protein
MLKMCMNNLHTKRLNMVDCFFKLLNRVLLLVFVLNLLFSNSLFAQQESFVSRKGFFVYISERLIDTPSDLTSTQLRMYRDLADVSYREKKAIFHIIKDTGFIGNAQTKQFYPYRDITYAEVAVVLYRYLVNTDRLDSTQTPQNKFFGSHWAASSFNSLVDQGFFQNLSVNLDLIAPQDLVLNQDAVLVANYLSEFLRKNNTNIEEPSLELDQLIDQENIQDNMNVTQDIDDSSKSSKLSSISRKKFIIQLAKTLNGELKEVSRKQRRQYKDLDEFTEEELKLFYFIISDIGFVGKKKSKKYYPDSPMIYADLSQVLYRLIESRNLIDSDKSLQDRYFDSHWSAKFFNFLAENTILSNLSINLDRIDPNTTVLEDDASKIIKSFNDYLLSKQVDSEAIDDRSEDVTLENLQAFEDVDLEIEEISNQVDADLAALLGQDIQFFSEAEVKKEVQNLEKKKQADLLAKKAEEERIRKQEEEGRRLKEEADRIKKEDEKLKKLLELEKQNLKSPNFDLVSRKDFLIILSKSLKDSPKELTEDQLVMYSDIFLINEEDQRHLFHIINDIGFIGNAKTKEFYPDRSITYAEATVILYRFLVARDVVSKDDVSQTMYFGSHWSARYFNILVDSGLFLNLSNSLSNLSPKMGVKGDDANQLVNQLTNLLYKQDDQIGKKEIVDEILISDSTEHGEKAIINELNNKKKKPKKPMQSELLSSDVNSGLGIVSQAGSNRKYIAGFLKFNLNKRLGFFELDTDVELGGKGLSNNYIDYSYNEDTHQTIFSEVSLIQKEPLITIRKGFFTLHLGSKNQISLGRQVYSWGQINLFSLIDFALPIKSNTGGFSLRKEKNRMAQDSVLYQLKPMPQVAFQAYYIPKLNSSEFTQYYVNLNPIYDSIPVLDTNDAYEGDFVTILKNGSDIKSRNIPAKAFRLLLKPKFATIGITYFEGLTIFPTDIGHVKLVDIVSNEFTGSFYNHDRDLAVLPSKLLGFEFSKPFSKTNLKFEYTIKESYRKIFNINDMDPIVYQSSDQDIYHMSSNNKTVYQWVLDKNEGKNYIPNYLNSVSLGLDGAYDWGVLNTYVSLLYSSERKDYADIIEMENHFYKPIFRQTMIFSGFNLAKYLRSDKTQLLGFSGGVLSGSVGSSIYYEALIKNSWRLSLALEMMSYYSDVVNLNKKMINESVEPTLRIGVFRSF